MNKMSLTILQRWRRWSPKKNFQFRKFPKEDLGTARKSSFVNRGVFSVVIVLYKAVHTKNGEIILSRCSSKNRESRK